MYYVEWLRVRNCLRILAIVLGVLFAFAVIGRIAAGVQIDQTQAWIASESHKSDARVTRQRLADGTTQTTIVVPSDGTHIVIDDRGWNGKSITITGPGIETHGSPANIQVGSIGVHSTRSNRNGGTIVVNTNEPVTVRILFALAAFVALIVGTVLSGPLAKENTNHLEIAWTKPASRAQMALGMFAVDAAGLVISMAMTVVWLVLCTVLFEVPHFVVDQQTWPVLALCILTPLAWYALLTAASASLKRGWGAVVGLGWLAALILPGISTGFMAAQTPIFHITGVVLSWLMLFNPIMYVHLSSSAAPGNVDPAFGYMYGVLGSSAGIRAAMLVGLVILYSALSLAQWRRLEA
jgi:hypothetical protein